MLSLLRQGPSTPRESRPVSTRGVRSFSLFHASQIVSISLDYLAFPSSFFFVPRGNRLIILNCKLHSINDLNKFLSACIIIKVQKVWLMVRLCSQITWKRSEHTLANAIKCEMSTDKNNSIMQTTTVVPFWNSLIYKGTVLLPLALTWLKKVGPPPMPSLSLW